MSFLWALLKIAHFFGNVLLTIFTAFLGIIAYDTPGLSEHLIIGFIALGFFILTFASWKALLLKERDRFR